MLNASMLEAVWKSIGTELVIFGVTLGFAIIIRTLNVGKLVNGKVVAGGKHIAVPSKLTTEVSERCRSQDLDEASKPAGPLGVTLPAGGCGAARRSGRRAPAAMLDEVVNTMREQPSLRSANRVLQMYHEELRPVLRGDGLRIQEIARFSKNSPTDLYTTLMHCAIRVGRYHLVEGFLDDMVVQGVHRPLSFYESAMKQLAGQKQYHLALAVHDRLAADGLRPSTVTCSCLIGFAAEVGELQRAIEFFDKLAATTTPSIRAYMTVLRAHAKRQDFKASVDILHDMERRSVNVDSLALNVVLATGVAADQLEAVANLIAEADQRTPPIPDVVSYNTLVKGYAQRGNTSGASSTVDRMKARGLMPNAITFNTAMDAAVRSGDAAAAWRLLADMQRVGLRPDKFTCSIIVKGLAKAPNVRQVQDALALLKEVDSACDPTLKSTLYHSVFDAAARASGPGGGVSLQAQAFAQMRAQRVQASPAAQRLMMQALPSVGRED